MMKPQAETGEAARDPSLRPARTVLVGSLSWLRKQLQPTHCKYEGPRKARRLWFA
uniref:MGC39584 protein n=1 Tax=Homo sapiens TaxID=9606 RepID=Q8NCQ8_HUMAN